MLNFSHSLAWMRVHCQTRYRISSVTKSDYSISSKEPRRNANHWISYYKLWSYLIWRFWCSMSNNGTNIFWSLSWIWSSVKKGSNFVHFSYISRHEVKKNVKTLLLLIKRKLALGQPQNLFQANQHQSVKVSFWCVTKVLEKNIIAIIFLENFL